MSPQYTVQQLPMIEDNSNTSPVYSLRKGEETILNGYNIVKEDRFPIKLYHLLEDVERFGNKSIISWSNDGSFFVVHQPKVFAESWMKKYFNQSKYKSFQRQLNFYEFQRVSHGKVLGVYSHPLFRRGNMETLNKIRRTKQQKTSAASLTLKARNKGVEVKKKINKAPSTTTTTTRTVTSTSALTSTVRDGSFFNHSSLQTPRTTMPNVPISSTMKNQTQLRTVSCDYYSNNIITPPKQPMLHPALSVRDNMNHAISLTMKSFYNNNNINNVTWNRNSLGSLGSSSLYPILDSNLLYEDLDDDATSIGTIEDVYADMCKTAIDQVRSQTV